MPFAGFPPSALAFYAGLEADNSRTYWTEHKVIYEHDVRDAMRSLADALGDRFTPVHVFRPNRDVRFSRDKSPYKTHCGAVHEREGGAINYVHLSAAGVFVASGFYMLARDQLARLREALLDDRTGPAFVGAVEAVTGAGLEVGPGGEAPLKRAPRGVPVDHPRIEWLRWKGAIARLDLGSAPVIHRPELVQRIIEVWDAAEPLDHWLETHVGPSAEPPEDARRF